MGGVAGGAKKLVELLFFLCRLAGITVAVSTAGAVISYQ